MPNWSVVVEDVFLLTGRGVAGIGASLLGVAGVDPGVTQPHPSWDVADREDVLGWSLSLVPRRSHGASLVTSGISCNAGVYGSLLPAVDEGVTTALEQRFAKFPRTNRGLEPDASSGPELS